jgi:hypothetical protein
MTVASSQAESAQDIDQIKVAQTRNLIKTLLASLPDADRARFLHELSTAIKPMSGPRAGEVLGAIVQLFPKRESWTVSELKQLIDDRGINATPKEVYNAVSYLARRGHIRRVGYGRYLIDGVPFVTAEDMGGQPSITEGDQDD